MRFDPNDAVKHPGFSLLEPGVYPFQVLEAEDKTSSGGNDMIALKLLIGASGHVYDNLVGHPKMIYRIRHFFNACGIGEHFEKGQISAANCQGKTGMCQIDIEPAKNGKKARNVVVDYVSPDRVESAKAAVANRAEAAPADELAADDIPW